MYALTFWNLFEFLLLGRMTSFCEKVIKLWQRKGNVKKKKIFSFNFDFFLPIIFLHISLYVFDLILIKFRNIRKLFKLKI